MQDPYSQSVPQKSIEKKVIYGIELPRHRQSESLEIYSSNPVIGIGQSKMIPLGSIPIPSNEIQ